MKTLSLHQPSLLVLQKIVFPFQVMQQQFSEKGPVKMSKKVLELNKIDISYLPDRKVKKKYDAEEWSWIETKLTNASKMNFKGS